METIPVEHIICKAVVGSLPQAIVTLNKGKRILFCNNEFQSLVGLSMTHLYLERIDSVLRDNDLNNMIDKVLEEGTTGKLELLYKKGDEGKRILKVIVKKMSLPAEGIKDILLITFEDISEKGREEVEKIHSEELQDIVKVAHGIAHEMGNSLCGISSILQFIKEEKLSRKDVDITEEIDLLRDNIDQMSKLLSSLRDFNYPERFQFSREDINKVIKRTIALMEKEAVRRQVVVDTDLSPGIPLFWADRRQLEHLFLNLLKNALESISEGGRIGVKTYFSSQPYEEASGSVIIEISDTGSGIPVEDLKYIFKPFFSTKNRGHGLGLYMCQKIVEGHHGSIHVNSERGRGSIFTVTFPVFHSPLG